MDLVVSGSEIGSCIDEVNVEVGVIILLKLSCGDILGSDAQVRDIQLGENLSKNLLILRSSLLLLFFLSGLLGCLSWQFNFDLLELEGRNMDSNCLSSNPILISILCDAKVVGNEVSTGVNKGSMERV